VTQNFPYVTRSTAAATLRSFAGLGKVYMAESTDGCGLTWTHAPSPTPETMGPGRATAGSCWRTTPAPGSSSLKLAVSDDDSDSSGGRGSSRLDDAASSEFSYPAVVIAAGDGLVHVHVTTLHLRQPDAITQNKVIMNDE
jgi:hypothetical protein